MSSNENSNKIDFVHEIEGEMKANPHGRTPDLGFGNEINEDIHNQVKRVDAINEVNQKKSSQVWSMINQLKKRPGMEKFTDVVSNIARDIDAGSQKNYTESQQLKKTLGYKGETLRRQDNIIDVEKEFNSDAKQLDVVLDEENDIEEYKTPKEILSYLERLMKKNPEFSGSLKVLKFDIEDDTSLPEVLSKLEKAKNSDVLSKKEFDICLGYLGVLEMNAEEEVKEKISDIKVGDWVNWKLDSLKWDEARRVSKISDDGYVYLDGMRSFIPSSDLEKVSKMETPVSYVGFGEKNISTDTDKDLNVGDVINFQGSDKEISGVDKDWITFTDGTMISRKEYEKGGFSYTDLDQEKIKRDEELEDLFNKFNYTPFTVEDYYNEIITNPSKADLDYTTRLFDGLVFDGLLKKNDDGTYQFIPYDEDHTEDTELGENIENKNDEEIVGDVNNEEIKLPESSSDELSGDIEEGDEVLPNVESEDINEQLSKARAEYARVLVEYKNKVREKKGFWRKISDDLGFEKPMPEVDKPQELLDAEKAYMEAKKNKARMFFGQDEIIKYKGKTKESLSLKEGESILFNENLLNHSEEEYRILQKKMLENTPPLEKGIIKKSFEKWTKLPLPARIALTTTLMTGVGLAFGTVAVGGVGATLAYRGARSLTGASLGQFVGGMYGLKKEKEYLEKNDEASLEYGKNIDANNFEEKERQLAQFFEKEENQKKKDFLKKAGIMAAVGAGFSFGADTAFKDFVGSAPGSVSRGNIVDSKSQPSGLSRAFESKGGLKQGESLGNKLVPEQPSGVKAPTGNTPVKPVPAGQEFTQKISPEIKNDIKLESVKPIKVELSSKGFVQTFDDMKSKLKAQYPDEAKMPKGVKDFMQTENAELAKKYGFYDPDKNLSGMGMKGESLSLDEKGELHYNHLDGKSDILDTESHKFSGKMFGVEEAKPEMSPEEISQKNDFIVPERPTLQNIVLEDVPSEISNPEVKVEDLVNPNENLSSVPTSKSFDFQFESKSFHIDVVDVADKKEILVDNVKIAEQVPYPNGQKGVMLQLLDKYQDGKKYAPIRAAFSQAQLENLDLLRGSTKIIEGQTVVDVPFENGKINIFRGIGDNKNMMKVYLNGKEIAGGLITEKGSKVELLNNIPKGGLFFADTVYERAFNLASKTIKTMKIIK